MIPSSKELAQKLNSILIEKLLLLPNNYFAIAEEYTKLQKIFVTETFLESIMLWIDMVIAPLFNIVKAILSMKPPELFTILSLQKAVTLWKDWFRFKELRLIIRDWISISRSVGGPYISTNDAEYHTFVYADAMVRLQTALLTLISEKRTKRTK